MKLLRANPAWVIGGSVAFIGHAAVLTGAMLAGGFDTPPRIEEPVVMVELPPSAAMTGELQPAVPEEAPSNPASEPRMVEQTDRPPLVKAPIIDAPLPKEFVSAPSKAAPRPVQQAKLSRPVESPSTRAISSAPKQALEPTAASGQSPEAKRDEANYYAKLSAHLNRKKRYPKEAKKARQQGVVTVRFTVHSDGRISATSIRKSSGHALLDQATIELMQRVAPLPKFPRSMTRDSVTISLPIDYSLRTN